MGVLKCEPDVTAGKFTLLEVADMDRPLKISEVKAKSLEVHKNSKVGKEL